MFSTTIQTNGIVRVSNPQTIIIYDNTGSAVCFADPRALRAESGEESYRYDQQFESCLLA